MQNMRNDVELRKPAPYTIPYTILFYKLRLGVQLLYYLPFSRSQNTQPTPQLYQLLYTSLSIREIVVWILFEMFSY